LHQHGNADGLSRLPVETETEDVDGASIFNVAQISALPVASREVELTPKKDSVLSRVYRYKQSNQKWYHDYHCQGRKYAVGQTVMALNFCVGPKCVQGVVVDIFRSFDLFSAA